MAGDLIQEVRRATLIRLKSDISVTSILPAESIYTSKVPAERVWPFGRFEAPTSTPINMSCVDGATVRFLWSSFAKPRMDGQATLETAEDFASRIGSACKVSLHNRRVPILDTTVLFRVISSRLVQDRGEADAYQSILSIQARVLAA